MREVLLRNLGRLRGINLPQLSLSSPTFGAAAKQSLKNHPCSHEAGWKMAQLSSYSLVQQQLGEFHVVGTGHWGEGVLFALLIPDFLQFP